MKRIVQRILLILAILLAIISVPIPGTAFQVSLDRIELANMKDRVQAIREFEMLNKRLPSLAELRKLSEELRSRGYPNHLYWIDTTPRPEIEHYPSGWPATGGWVLSLWQGDWAEYYSSWDDHYSLAEKATWKYYLKPFGEEYLCVPAFSFIFFLLSYLLKRNQNQQRIHSIAGSARSE